MTPVTTNRFNNVSQFFFQQEVPYGPALVRMAMSFTLLFVVVPRWIHAREFFSSDGSAAPLHVNFGVDMLPELPGTVVVGLMTILLFTLITSCVGWCTRASMIISFVLYTYLNLMDSLSSLTKYSVIASHILLLLSLSNCGTVWSVDSWLKRRQLPKRNPRHRSWRSAKASDIWPRRLMQIMIGCVYFGAAMTKMHTPEYFNSDQMRYWMLSNVNHANPFGEYLATAPWMLVVFAYITILWEVSFLLLAWRGPMRLVTLSVGVVFHIMTTLTLGLYIFPMVTISIYFAFINERDVRRIAISWRRCQRYLNKGQLRPKVAAQPSWSFPASVRYPAPVVFAFALSFFTLSGIELEHWLDPYGLRRPEGPHELVELDPEYVEQMLEPSGRIREEDKVFSLEVGRDTLGGVLIGRRDVYTQGDCILIQCTLSPPHEDMWLECNLHDGDDRLLDRVGQPAERSQTRVNFYYNLPKALDPGTYHLVLRSRGKEITRREITLLPDKTEQLDPVAN